MRDYAVAEYPGGAWPGQISWTLRRRRPRGLGHAHGGGIGALAGHAAWHHARGAGAEGGVEGTSGLRLR
jgi:hypothetical protein